MSCVSTDDKIWGGGKDRPEGFLEILVRRGGSYAERPVFTPEGKQQGSLLLPSGKVEEVIQGHNLCLNRIRIQIAHLLVGHDSTTRYINRMVFGTGGHAVGDTSTPISPDVADTGLEGQILQKNFATFEFPTQYSVRCVAFVLESEANGFVLCESGLMSADNTLVARRTFPGLNKTSDFVFEFRHGLLA